MRNQPKRCFWPILPRLLYTDEIKGGHLRRARRSRKATRVTATESTGQPRRAPTSISTPPGRHTPSLTIAGFIRAPSMDPSMAFFRRAAAFFTCWKSSSVTLCSGNSSSRCVRSIRAQRIGGTEVPWKTQR